MEKCNHTGLANKKYLPFAFLSHSLLPFPSLSLHFPFTFLLLSFYFSSNLILKKGDSPYTIGAVGGSRSGGSNLKRDPGKGTE